MTGKMSWRNPPIITIALILINCFVYFLFQLNDNANYIAAINYYQRSGLDQIEITSYLEYVKNQDNIDIDIYAYEELDKESLIEMYNKMNEDTVFSEKLQQEEIITPSHPSYAKWRALRNQYEKRLSKVVFIKYGFTPSNKKPITFLTHMFLHGGFGHLFGNMIFLWVVGSIIEMGCGRAIYSGLYLSAGLAAVVFFGLIYSSSTRPLVGASGAIAGLMGALPVLFGKKKIKIFYSLGFFFNYIKIPAIILLPIWIGNELFQLTYSMNTQVAYIAHIGGLIGGGLISFILLKVVRVLDESAFSELAAKEEEKDTLSPLIEKALGRIEKLDIDGARGFLDQVLIQDPVNITAMTHLFNMDKINPESPQFHKTANKLLSSMTRTKEMDEKFYDFYNQYIQLTKKPQLSPELYVRVASIASIKGQTDVAEKIIAGLLKQKPDTPGLASSLLKLSMAFGRKNMAEKRKTCLKIIHSKFPQSSEAQIAKRALAN